MLTRMVGLEKKTKIMKALIIGCLCLLLFSSCVVTTRPVQSPRVFVETRPNVWYYHSPTYWHHNHNHIYYHNNNAYTPRPRPRYYGPRR